ncbi:hypothetical protein BO83DRAFT_68768 [Aspergillus eucalypticola CBS 122712]|uniref:Uncharacterized protein n=1 Tax=Aspergillus eucalypticola (strain CBS 122712 / IBT 29274) TaxID=1448314 RepID=A0A317V756_ASPEC|nr:uncharacterized protein BO83DRAFT_68768 [Aspergillus eucalypticola CBS 122712]PWY69279.1 hypothetical protein BO83DRAFT_68768 [Aspergillus eucalypticola CBS 122712]
MGFSLIRPGARVDFHCQLRLFHLPCRHVCTTFIPCAVLLRYLFRCFPNSCFLCLSSLLRGRGVGLRLPVRSSSFFCACYCLHVGNCRSFCLIKPFSPSFDPLNHAGWEKDALAETRKPEITGIPEGNPLYWILFELPTTLPCCDTLFAAFIWTTANHCAGRLPGYLYT